MVFGQRLGIFWVQQSHWQEWPLLCLHRAVLSIKKANQTIQLNWHINVLNFNAYLRYYRCHLFQIVSRPFSLLPLIAVSSSRSSYYLDLYSWYFPLEISRDPFEASVNKLKVRVMRMTQMLRTTTSIDSRCPNRQRQHNSPTIAFNRSSLLMLLFKMVFNTLS